MRQRLRHHAPALLADLLAAGLVLVGVGGVDGHPGFVALGAGLVLLGLVGWFLLHRGSAR